MGIATRPMTLRRIQEMLSASCVTADPPLDLEALVGCASDLMSNVLAFGRPHAILLTGLTSPQTVRTAEIADCVAICFAYGKQPPAVTVELAEGSGIPLFVTPFTLYVASGKLYELGLPGCPEAT